MILPLGLLLVSCWLQPTALDEDTATTSVLAVNAPEDGGPDFTSDVLPLLEAHCFRCHGPQTPSAKSGLRFEGLNSLLRGGDRGPSIVPGDADSSLLIQSVRYEHADLEMPPDGPMPPADVATFERWVAAGASWSENEPPIDRAAIDHFETVVRPLLARECFECHGPSARKARGGLRMTGRQALLDGGESGPAITPGVPDDSLLIQAVRRLDHNVAMPPRSELSDSEVATLTRWVANGAPWPDDGGKRSADSDVEAGRRWWSFQPVEGPHVPTIPTSDFVRNPIDAFVLARLNTAQLTPAPPASRRDLMRRATFDLTGLPSSFEELEHFASSNDDGDWNALIDRHLARPEYGERWGRHWLDVVRFAQTNGYERDREKLNAWRYRDYVVDAFNNDVPYDRFLREQLAGDKLDDVTDASRVATGFYRLGVWDSEPDDKTLARLDESDDVLRTISEGFMGISLGCARCHDHKFDPISQRDYNAMLAFIGNVRPYEKSRFALDSPTFVPLGFTPDAERRWERDRAQHIAGLEADKRAIVRDVTSRQVPLELRKYGPELLEIYRLPEAQRTPAQVALLKQTLNESEAITKLLREMERSTFTVNRKIKLTKQSFKGDLDWALAAVDGEESAVPVEVQVDPSFVRVLCPTDDDSRPGSNAGADLRRELAEWITSERHPLTARVFVNRVWQHHFGRGLVTTPNDFGVRGAAPSHPALLDWLAHEFMNSGWSVKALHRLIMTSSTYRMSSRVAPAEAVAADPDNTLLWRQNPRRLESEAIRDAMLAVSGTLDHTRGGRGFFPRLGRDALAGASRPGEGWESSTETERNRRGIYSFAKRNMPVPLMELFDASDTSLPSAQRGVTTVPTQALTLLNGAFANRMAAALRRRLENEAQGDTITRAFELTLGRRPTDDEHAIAVSALRTQTAAFAALRPTLAFTQNAPSRLHFEFVKQAEGEELLVTPGAPWESVKGEWSGGYNSTVAPTPGREPAAVLPSPMFDDGEVRARLLMRAGTHFASLMLRASIAGDVATGIEVRLDAAAGRVSVMQQDSASFIERAAASAPLEVERWYDVRVRVDGARVRVWLDGTDATLLDVTEKGFAPRGSLGVRTWGESLVIDTLTLQTGNATLAVKPENIGTPEQRALEALCLALLNLNEFIYVD